MFNPITVPPKLLLRALEDLTAIADVARRLPEVQLRAPQLEARAEEIVTGLIDDLGAMRAGLERLEQQVGTMSSKLDGLQEQMAPIQELPAMRQAVEPLEGRMLELKETVKPIAQLPAMREAVEPLNGQMETMSEKLDGLREEMSPIQELPAVRRAIEPLGDQLGGKMDVLTEHVDSIEPMFREVTDAINDLVPKIEEVRLAVGPVGEVVDNLPKFMKN